MRSAVVAKSLVVEDLVEGREADQTIDDSGYFARDIIAKTKAGGLEAPVETSDDE